MAVPQVVLDTNVLLAAMRSRRGASHRLLSLVDAGRFQLHLSVPLVLEYEEVLSRSEHQLTPSDVRDVIDYFCSVASLHEIYFLWRPHLNDPSDEMVLELAFAANCDYIVTFNIHDFQDVEILGLEAIGPKEFLRIIGEIP